MDADVLCCSKKSTKQKPSLENSLPLSKTIAGYFRVCYTQLTVSVRVAVVVVNKWPK